MKNLIKKMKTNLYNDYKNYLLLILISFIISFSIASIYHSPSDSESLIIYSNYNFSLEERELIKNNIDDSITNFEVYYDQDFDATRVSTTGAMVSDLFIFKEEVMNLLVTQSNMFLNLKDIKDIEVDSKYLYNDYAYIISEESYIKSVLKMEDVNYFILVNSSSTNIGEYGKDNEHKEVFNLINKLLDEV